MPGEEARARLEIQPVNRGECTVLRVKGAFGQGTAPSVRLRDEMAGLEDPPRLILDLEGVTAWDDTGVAAVLAAAKRVMSAGGRLIIAATPADLVESFQRKGLDRRLEFRETVPQAVNEFRAGT